MAVVAAGAEAVSRSDTFAADPLIIPLPGFPAVRCETSSHGGSQYFSACDLPRFHSDRANPASITATSARLMKA